MKQVRQKVHCVDLNYDTKVHNVDIKTLDCRKLRLTLTSLSRTFPLTQMFQQRGEGRSWLPRV